MMKRIAGFTLIELVITIAILGILASAAMPMLQMSVQRSKEHDLKADLRQIRAAIDAYKLAYDAGRIELKDIEKSGYPPNLAVLVEGVADKSDPNGKRVLKFLRRVPVDPMLTKDQVIEAEGDAALLWGLRSYASTAENPKVGDDVYDVYSLSPLTGSNGVPYANW